MPSTLHYLVQYGFFSHYHSSGVAVPVDGYAMRRALTGPEFWTSADANDELSRWTANSHVAAEIAVQSDGAHGARQFAKGLCWQPPKVRHGR